jgi:hypothetical protein
MAYNLTTMKIVTLGGAASLALACAARYHVVADTPPAPTTSAKTAVAMATSATSTPGTTNPVTPASVSSSSDQAERIDQSLVKRGYRPRRLKGQLRYCLSQTLTGTHFSNTVCLSEAQIKANDQHLKSELDTINRAGRAVCPNNSCN